MNVLKRLAVVGVYWNPSGHKLLADNVSAWLDSMPKNSEVQVWLIEIATAGDHSVLFEGGHRTVRFESEDHIWCIESARNAVVSKYITDVDAVAFVDIDVVFEVPDWWRLIFRALEKRTVIQGFETAHWLDAEGKITRTKRAIGWGYRHQALVEWPDRSEGFHVGFCWAARRSLWDEGAPGIPDWVCFGANDRAMALACTGRRHPTLGGWWRKRLDAYTEALQKWMGDEPFGYAPLTVSHRWHGDESNRRYAERAKRLEHVDWPKHCRYNEEGLLSWTKEGKGRMFPPNMIVNITMLFAAGIEKQQEEAKLGGDLGGWGASAWTLEDMPSNYMGAKFGVEIGDKGNWADNITLVADEFGAFLESCGVVKDNWWAGPIMRFDAAYISAITSKAGFTADPNTGFDPYTRTTKPVKTVSHNCLCDQNNVPYNNRDGD